MVVWFFFVFAVVFFIVSVLVSNLAGAGSCIVDDDGAGDYTSIQDAINASVDGDTIFVWNGTYQQNVIVNKSLDIVGNSSSDTFVVSPGSSPDGIFNVTEDWVNISGLNFSDASTTYDSGISIKGNHTNISYCYFYNSDYGISYDQYPYWQWYYPAIDIDAVVYNCTFNMMTLFSECALFFPDITNVRILNNTFFGYPSDYAFVVSPSVESCYMFFAGNNLDGCVIYVQAYLNDSIINYNYFNNSEIWCNGDNKGMSNFEISNNTLRNTSIYWEESYHYNITIRDNYFFDLNPTYYYAFINIPNARDFYYIDIINNTLNNCDNGINIGTWESINSSIVNNKISNCNYDGIYSGVEGECNITNNQISNCDTSISLYSFGAVNYVSNNIIDNSSNYGIKIYNSEDFIIHNNFINDSNYGFYVSGSHNENNLIFNNYINNCSINAYDSGSTNAIWNITKTLGTNIIGGPYLGGNYWSDYNGTDANDDYLGDTEYIISSGDQYPLFPMLAQFKFQPSSPNIDELVTFNDYSDILIDYVDTYYWNFGDGTTASGKIVKHSFDETGIYKVRLILHMDGFLDFAEETIVVGEDRFHIIFPFLGKHLYTVPEMYQLLRVDRLGVCSSGLVIVFLDTGFTPRVYNDTDLGRIKPLGDVFSSPFDAHGHGTWVSYAIMYGVQKFVPNSVVYSYRVFDEDGYCDVEDLLTAFSVIKSLHPDIVSFSGGGLGNPDDPVSKAVEDLRNSGVVVVVAAGNSGPSLGSILSPACSRGALAVGAIDPMYTILDRQDDIVTSWSSRGPVSGVSPKPDYTAPGESIIGPWLKIDRVVSGTSMATPIVAGGIAVAMGNNKLLLDITNILYFWDSALKPSIVYDSVEETVYSKTPSDFYGYGIPDFLDASNTIFWKCFWLIFLWVLVFSIIVCTVVYVYKRFTKKNDKRKTNRRSVIAR